MPMEYSKTGSVTFIDDKPYFLFDGSAQGFIFKDEEAYFKDWNAPCYVPEYAKSEDEVTLDGITYHCGGSQDDCDWYSHYDILSDCYNNQELCDYVFSNIDWQYVSTAVEEMQTYNDDFWNYWWRFVKVGRKVYWNDPAGETSGWYRVAEIGAKDGEYEEDTIVLIYNKYGSEAEVNLWELSEKKPKQIKS